MIKGRNSQISILKVIIVALVVMGVLLWYGSSSASILKKGSDIEVCRLSVLAQAQSKLLGSSPLQLKCNRRQVKLFNDKVEINGKKDNKYDFRKLDDNTVNKVVAEELRLCWYMMGQGELNVFKQEIADAAVTVTSEKVCTVCSEISFEKSIDRNKRFSGLVDYLKSNKIPSQDIYYFDYLIKSQRNLYALWGNLPWSQIYTPWGWGSTDRITDSYEENLKNYKGTLSDFNPEESYVVYFLASKPSWLKEKFKAVDSAYYIGLGNPAKVAKECRRLVN